MHDFVCSALHAIIFLRVGIRLFWHTWLHARFISRFKEYLVCTYVCLLGLFLTKYKYCFEITIFKSVCKSNWKLGQLNRSFIFNRQITTKIGIPLSNPKLLNCVGFSGSVLINEHSWDFTHWKYSHFVSKITAYLL